MVGLLHKHARYEIVEAIREAERRTGGEIRVHVRPRCGQDPMKEARKVFQKLRMHRTREHNAVLIFVAVQSRRFAIVGDEGIHQKVGDGFWDSVSQEMQGLFKKNDIVGGIVAAVRGVGEKLTQHYPSRQHDKNELSDSMSEDPR